MLVTSEFNAPCRWVFSRRFCHILITICFIESVLFDFHIAQYINSCRQRKDELDSEIFEILLTFSDFLVFKEMMLAYRSVSAFYFIYTHIISTLQFSWIEIHINPWNLGENILQKKRTIKYNVIRMLHYKL